MGQSRFEDVLAEQVARLGDRPLLTYYDEGTGERTELGYATFGNWTGKTANLLADHDVEPGDAVTVATDGHWAGFVAVAACGLVGARALVVSAGITPPTTTVEQEPRVAVVHERCGDVGTGARRFVVGESLGGRPSAADADVYVDEALASEDVYSDPEVDGDHEWLRLPDGRWLTQSEALTPGAEPPAGRILLTTPIEQALPTGVRVIAQGASMVAVRGGDAAALQRVFDVERCTQTLP